MKTKVVSIRDRASDLFSTPAFVPTTGAAVRSFQDAINNKETEFYKHPEDYDLYLLGEYDDNTGKVICEEDGPRMLAVGKDSVR